MEIARRLKRVGGVLAFSAITVVASYTVKYFVDSDNKRRRVEETGILHVRSFGLLDKYDGDKSGVLELPEVRRMYGEEFADDALRRFDSDGNGVLNGLEIGTLRKTIDCGRGLGSLTKQQFNKKWGGSTIWGD